MADLLRAEGFDVISALELGHAEWDGSEQLVCAAANRRATLTGELLRRILRLLDRVTRDEMKNPLRYLSEYADRG